MEVKMGNRKRKGATSPVVKLSMSRMRADTDTKLAFLEAVKERKEILFGKFSNEIENVLKRQAWEELLEKAKSLNIVAGHRDWTFVRDSVFGVWKTRTLEKRDNAGRTGTAGGRKYVLNEIDHAILDIIGNESPSVSGLRCGEVGDNVEVEVEVGVGVEDEFDLLDPGPTTSASAPQAHRPSTSASAPQPPVPETTGVEEPNINSTSKRATTQNANAFRITTKRQEITLRDNVLLEKWTAQTDVMRQQEYNLKLQNWKLERELGIIGSQLTNGIKPFEVEIVDDN